MKNECDFCQAKVPHLHPVNDGAWAICDMCMDLHYRVLPRHHELTEKRKANLCGHGVPYVDCSCEEE